MHPNGLRERLMEPVLLAELIKIERQLKKLGNLGNDPVEGDDEHL
ncbi:MAG: hypothetical protein AAGA21_08155 [Pseudomonadota bacterium]